MGIVGVELTFDKPVKIVLPGEGANTPYFGLTQGAQRTIISNQCDSATAATVNSVTITSGSTDNRECFFRTNGGNDMTVQTTHFTSYGTISASSSSSSSGSGSSSGGSGRTGVDTGQSISNGAGVSSGISSSGSGSSGGAGGIISSQDSDTGRSFVNISPINHMVYYDTCEDNKMRIIASTYGDNLSAMVTGDGFKIPATDVTGIINPFQYLSVQSAIPVHYYTFEAEIPHSSSYEVKVYDKSNKEYVSVVNPVLQNGNSCAIGSVVLNDPTGATVITPFEPYFVEPADTSIPVSEEPFDDSQYQFSAPKVPQLLQDTILEKSISDMPLIIPVPFVSETEDPQEYVDQYNNDETFRNWFDANYPQYDSISQAVGLEMETIYDDTIPELECGDGTVVVNGTCQVIISESDSSAGGGCLIATATYGTELAPQVQMLREIRDNSLLSTESGTSFIGIFNDVYYSFSPIIADYERENPVFRELVKVAITPMISSLSIMSLAEEGSEISVLGYGISLIILNGMMYVGIPAVIVIGIRKRF